MHVVLALGVSLGAAVSGCGSREPNSGSDSAVETTVVSITATNPSDPVQTDVDSSTTASETRTGSVAVGDLSLSTIYSPAETVPEAAVCSDEMSRVLGAAMFGLCLESWALVMSDSCIECEGARLFREVNGQWSEYAYCTWMQPGFPLLCLPEFPVDVSLGVRCGLYPDNYRLVNLSLTGCPPRIGDVERVQVDDCDTYVQEDESWSWAESRRVLEPCREGRWVMALQESLIDLGYPLEADGLYGPMTSRAIVDVQLANGLVVSGVADESTLELLLGTSTLG